MTKRKKLEAFLAGRPDDAFARYGLAMECANQGDSEAALEHYRRLLRDHPTYVVGYFQCGQLLARLGRNREAREMLTAGMAAAEKAGDSHAREEMQAALASLPA